jgi:hypothetical protein
MKPLKPLLRAKDIVLCFVKVVIKRSNVQK